MDHLGPGLQRSGPQLRSLQVEQDATGSVHFGGRASQVLCHAPPGRWPVVRTVDAHDVHAGPQEFADQVVGIRGLGGHGDHDPDLPASGSRSQEELRLRCQCMRATGKVHRQLEAVRPFHGPSRQLVQSGQHGIDARQSVGLGLT